MILRMLREDGGSVYIEKGRLIRAPARSPLRVTEPDKSRVTYPDSMPFSRTGFFGMFPKQNTSEFPAATQNCKSLSGLHAVFTHRIFRNVSKTKQFRISYSKRKLQKEVPSAQGEEPILALPCQARRGEHACVPPLLSTTYASSG